jgi:hypothetical protein
LLATLILPHPGTTGRARAVELALTALCSPLIFTGALIVAIRNRWRRKISISGEAMPVFVMVLFGSLPLDLLLALGGLGVAARIGVGLGSVLGLVVRGLSRARASRAACAP